MKWMNESQKKKVHLHAHTSTSKMVRKKNKITNTQKKMPKKL